MILYVIKLGEERERVILQTHVMSASLISRHIYHKGCIDPWLIEHRTCPICKLDILHAYGMHVSIDNILVIYCECILTIEFILTTIHHWCTGMRYSQCNYCCWSLMLSNSAILYITDVIKRIRLGFTPSISIFDKHKY